MVTFICIDLKFVWGRRCITYTVLMSPGFKKQANVLHLNRVNYIKIVLYLFAKPKA